MDGTIKIPDELAKEMTPKVRAFVDQLLAVIDQQRQEIDRLNDTVDRLNKKIEDLNEKLNKSPRNSSKPPSGEHPHAKPARKRKRSKRKRGGQPGHERNARPHVPTDQCDQVVKLKPTECERCDQALDAEDPNPRRHQVWDVPPIKPFVTEYQLHAIECSCGHVTRAKPPAGVSTSQAGPGLVCWVALLMGCFRLSKRRVAMFLEIFLNQPCSTGWVVKIQNRATQALRPVYDELVERLPEQATLAIDETPYKQGANKSWLWTFVAGSFTVFRIAASRKATALSNALGETFAGVVHCDRAKMYWRLGRLQWCWAHLKRDFQALIDHPDNQVKRLGHDLMRQTRTLFAEWSKCHAGQFDRVELRRRLAPVRAKVNALLLRGRFSGNSRLVGMCKELWDHRDWLWTFLECDGVEPTNNASERSLRHAVIWRKLSFGTQSASGSRFVETLLTVVETCRQQSRDTFAFLLKAQLAHAHNAPAPSLLPNEAP